MIVYALASCGTVPLYGAAAIFEDEKNVEFNFRTLYPIFRFSARAEVDSVGWMMLRW